ncbi:MAG: GrpB family protein, partial [Acidimicrobiales bacterium]
GLLFVDWLAAHPDMRAEYLAVKREAQRADGDIARYVEAKEPWLREAYRGAWDWADAVHWRP